MSNQLQHFDRMETNLLLSSSFNELVFEHRHKDYGAYNLRRTYTRRVFSSLLIATLSFGTALGTYIFLQNSAMANEAQGSLRVDTEILIAPPESPVEPIKPKPTPPTHIEPPAKSDVKQPELTDPVVTTKPVDPLPPNTNTGGDPSGVTGGTGTHPVPNNPCLDCPPNDSITTTAKPKVFDWVEKMPESDLADNFIKKHVVYPDFERSLGKTGTVYVQFIVRKDGSLDGFKVVKGVSAGIDREALRVAKMMPNWSPGLQNGQAVDVICTKPITFKLN